MLTVPLPPPPPPVPELAKDIVLVLELTKIVIFAPATIFNVLAEVGATRLL